jgi:hypothetical protein
MMISLTPYELQNKALTLVISLRAGRVWQKKDMVMNYLDYPIMTVSEIEEVIQYLGKIGIVVEKLEHRWNLKD